jgi:hypothetical protein
MKSESGRMKGDSNGKDEKMRAENGRIKDGFVITAYFTSQISRRLIKWRRGRP